MNSKPVTHTPNGSASDQTLAGRRICVIVTGGVPHPTRGASTVLMFYYIDALLAAGAAVQAILVGIDAASDAQAPAAFRAAVCRPEDLELASVQCGETLRSHRFSLIDASRGAAANVQTVVSRFRADSVICFDIVAVAIGRYIEGPTRLAWLGDLRFQTIWYHALYNVRERPHRAHELAYAAVQYRHWRRLYAAALKDFSEVVAASASSVGQLARLGVRARYAPYPWPGLAPAGAVSPPPEKPSFLFFGNLVGLGSRSSLHLLTRGILPELRRAWGEGGFALRIAGRETLDARNRRNLAAVPEIEFLGFVDDLAAEIGRAHAVLAPIAVPVGNRSRILTALSAGAPVIAHENAALGNPDLRDGDTCLLAGDAAAFVRHMRAAVDVPQTMAAIGRRGREMYQCRFAPDAAAGLFADLLQ